KSRLVASTSINLPEPWSGRMPRFRLARRAAGPGPGRSGWCRAGHGERGGAGRTRVCGGAWRGGGRAGRRGAPAGVGGGAQRLSSGDVGLELLQNAAATGAGLFAIILMFGAVSGGHFNPVVSFADAALGGLSWRDAAAYLPAQVGGCIGGAVLANLMFSDP